MRGGQATAVATWKYVTASAETVREFITEWMPQIYRTLGCTVTPVPGMKDTYLERFNAEGFDSTAHLISIRETKTRGTRVTVKTAVERDRGPDLQLTEAQARAVAGASSSLMLDLIAHVTAEKENQGSPATRQREIG